MTHLIEKIENRIEQLKDSNASLLKKAIDRSKRNLSNSHIYGDLIENEAKIQELLNVTEEMQRSL